MNVDLRACCQGRKDAWDQFVRACSPLLFQAVVNVLSSRAGNRVDRNDVEDVVQSVFLRLVINDFRLLRTYDPGRASLSTWLTIVARSTAIDHLRAKPDAAASLQSVEHSLAHIRPGPANGSSIAAELDLTELPLHLLTDRQRLVLELLYVAEISVTEAAARLQVDEQTIRSTKHKALQRLRRHLHSTDPENMGISDAE